MAQVWKNPVKKNPVIPSLSNPLTLLVVLHIPSPLNVLGQQKAKTALRKGRDILRSGQAVPVAIVHEPIVILVIQKL